MPEYAPTTSDSELVRQSLDGRLVAYEELVRRWSGRVLAMCHSRVRCAHAAEDLAQETLLRGFRALRTLEDTEKFGPWLRGIARRACLDWLKRKQTSQTPFSVLEANGNPETLLASEPSNPLDELEHNDELALIIREAESLPDELCEVLMLYYYNEVTYHELAELLGVSAATVNARLTKARTLLRTRLAVGRS